MRLGVVTGLAIEAGRLGGGEDWLVATGAGAGAARAAAALIERGATALLSLGLAGGLDPTLAPGGLLLAEAVALPDGGRLPCDASWRASLRRALGREVHDGVLLGADDVLTSVAEKRAWAARSGAVAVDTESQHVALAAARAGLPFAALRAIVDPLDQSLPACLAGVYGGDGRLRPLVLGRGLLRRPGDLPALLRLAGQSRVALASLRRVGLLGAALAPAL